MRFASSAAAALLAACVSAVPTRTTNEAHNAPIQKRATITDAASVGYATKNGGTKGGAGGTTTTVSDLASFTAAAEADEAYVIVVNGPISGAYKTRVGSNKSIIGAGGSLEGVGLYIKGQSNVIVRNLKISKVLADDGDAIGIQESTNIWVDHCDLSSDMDHDKDYYDGLLDITHASDYITVSNSYLHDHYKSSLVGHSDSNADEDTGHLTVTYANNYFRNLNSRGPSVRFGTAHIFNSYYENVHSAINTRLGAQVLVESTVFEGCGDNAIYSADSDATGYAVVKDVALGGSSDSAPKGTLASVPYSYSLLGSRKTKASVTANAGAILSF
ncbi:polysaccharide lyase family 1 protein [Xylaria bambusicola]|uniref:polysaccharide lyase family 1 protein n=1 Tax=Xylaria bambusicola TaxID=326684 RepID=UPI002008022E|nr:polysaccharide lyase family 1 protein [Xylaria bambusicola]KAI0518037.1 polysaccharide lyase family 1 protein [Xylaria bambusicola]